MENQLKDCTVCGTQTEEVAMIWNSFICEPCEREVENSNVLAD
ncbi:sigma factor G inhibitor Gin [Ammoniphilus oxalaticus]|nr:sigma factor G inhibitor Gin [Ammoniphilus oxalaticus]